MREGRGNPKKLSGAEEWGNRSYTKGWESEQTLPKLHRMLKYNGITPLKF